MSINTGEMALCKYIQDTLYSIFILLQGHARIIKRKMKYSLAENNKFQKLEIFTKYCFIVAIELSTDFDHFSDCFT